MFVRHLSNVSIRSNVKKIFHRSQSSSLTEIDREKTKYKYFLLSTTRWKDNDQYGHVNNVVYYEWIDSIVNQYLIKRCEMKPLEDDIVGFVVSSYCSYYSPLEYPSDIYLGLNVQRIGFSSVDYRVGIFANEFEEKASAVGGFTHVFVHRYEQKSKEIPKKIKENLLQLVDHQSK